MGEDRQPRLEGKVEALGNAKYKSVKMERWEKLTNLRITSAEE